MSKRGREGGEVGGPNPADRVLADERRRAWKRARRWGLFTLTGLSIAAVGLFGVFGIIPMVAIASLPAAVTGIGINLIGDMMAIGGAYRAVVNAIEGISGSFQAGLMRRRPK